MASAPLSAPSFLDRSEQVFRPVVSNSSEMKDLTEIFKRVLEPLYGSQKEALEKIASGEDRKCFLLYEDTTPVGVIAFKTNPSNEFEQFGVVNSIEIKSLFVVASEKNSGRGIGGILLNKVCEEAKRLGLGHAGFHVTVSDTKSESLNFFRRKGFEVKHVWISRYQKNITEFLLTAPSSLPSFQEIQKVKGTAPILPQLLTPKVAQSIANAHWDDIHDLKLLPNGSFISGSKDNCILRWSANGELEQAISEVEPDLASEKNWITSIQLLNESYGISGDRSGKVALWSTDGDFMKTLNLKLPKGFHVSQAQNARRVNCFATGVNKSRPTFFVGFPTMFDEFNVIEGRTVASTTVHANDWVFCLHPLAENRLLVVTGCVLELFEKTAQKWSKRGTLIGEGKRVGRQRPFISSLIPLKNPSHFAMGVFGGFVKIFDVEAQKTVRDWHEHSLRVWKVEAIANSLIASSSEDRTIRLFDSRVEKSIAGITTESGQAHSLLSPNDQTLIAGVAAVNKANATESAHLLFYDLRK